MTDERIIGNISQSASMDEGQFTQSMDFVRSCSGNGIVHDGLFTRPSNRSGGNPPAEETVQESSAEKNHVLIAYFSIPENVDTNGVDAVASASVVVSDGEKLGNTEYVARIIQKTVGGELFRIETVQQYPPEHETLVDRADDEKRKKFRPELFSHLSDISKYDIIILGYPNWWADLPMPVYSFLEEYDFGAKTIIPFVTHGGSGFSSTLNTISELQPGALRRI